MSASGPTQLRMCNPAAASHGATITAGIEISAASTKAIRTI